MFLETSQAKEVSLRGLFCVVAPASSLQSCFLCLPSAPSRGVSDPALSDCWDLAGNVEAAIDAYFAADGAVPSEALTRAEASVPPSQPTAALASSGGQCQAACSLLRWAWCWELISSRDQHLVMQICIPDGRVLWLCSQKLFAMDVEGSNAWLLCRAFSAGGASASQAA